VKETGALKTILLSAGSEVQHAIAAAKTTRRRRAGRQRAQLLPLRPPAASLQGRGDAAVLPPSRCD